jgi:hypothetical protein
MTGLTCACRVARRGRIRRPQQHHHKACVVTTNARFVAFVGTFALPAQQIWLPGIDLQDPSTWDAPPASTERGPPAALRLHRSAGSSTARTSGGPRRQGPRRHPSPQNTVTASTAVPNVILIFLRREWVGEILIPFYMPLARRLGLRTVMGVAATTCKIGA